MLGGLRTLWRVVHQHPGAGTRPPIGESSPPKDATSFPRRRRTSKRSYELLPSINVDGGSELPRQRTKANC
eukprot:3999721-Amphidinium_carterae.1